MFLDNDIANYNSIASEYSSFAGKKEEEVLVLEQLILPNLCKGAHILDIGCAHGRTVKQLNIRGYQTTGTDISEELLHIARSNAPDTKFILGDIREIELQPIYDAVLSIDALCHILDLEELTNVFRKVYAAMHENGFFAFTVPVLEDEELEEISLDKDRPYYHIDLNFSDRYLYLQASQTHNQKNIREVKLIGFKLMNGVWQRSDSTVLVKDYLKSEIKSALVNAGFVEINEYNSKDFGHMPRTIFTCRKPVL